jgi:serine/threonine-protein kinase
LTAPADARRLGEIVGGKYRLTRFLAGGGMGVVYEAQHAVVRRRFAIKFLRRDYSERREILMRFQREAEAAGALESENVTAAVDFGVTDDGAPYIVMEFLVGESLEALLGRSRRLPAGRAADLCLQACRGIAAAHAAGIIHRDLKPHNLFLCRRQDGTDLVKVLDFGIAKLETFDDGLATRTGLVLGTPAYMSPEQARGDKDLDARADVYGLAAILYQLLSGEKPHPGGSHNAILHHIATQPAVPLDALALELPAALVALVERGLAAEVGARFSSAEALAEALTPFARREVWPAPEPPAATPVEEAPPAFGAGLPAASSAGARASAAPGPRRIVAGAAIAAVALVIGAAVAAIVGRSARHVARAEAPVASAALAPSTRGPSASSTPGPGASSAPAAAPVAPPARPVAPPAGAVDAVAATNVVAPPIRPRPAAAPAGHTGGGGRPRGRPSGRPEAPAAGTGTAAKPGGPADKPGAPPVTFDQQNPYN